MMSGSISTATSKASGPIGTPMATAMGAMEVTKLIDPGNDGAPRVVSVAAATPATSMPGARERAAAVASLLGGESPNGHQNGAAAEDGLESDAPARKRSRGRRGGRGRSRAKQGSSDGSDE